jgi:hypothetical protein
MRDGVAGGILILAFWITFLTGWVMNIYKFSQYDFDTPLKAEVIRGIGIVVAPMGAVIGFLDIKDK